MSSLDFVFLALVALCVLLGLTRGIWRELISLAVVAGAVIASWFFGGAVAKHFDFLSDPASRRILGFIAVFVGAYVIAGVAAFVLRVFLGGSPPGGKARVAGAMAGFARGLAIVVVVVFFAALTPARKHAWWNDSLAVRLARPPAQWIQARLPPDIARHFARR